MFKRVTGQSTGKRSIWALGWSKSGFDLRKRKSDTVTSHCRPDHGVSNWASKPGRAAPSHASPRPDTPRWPAQTRP